MPEVSGKRGQGIRASFSEAFSFGALSFVSGGLLGIASSIVVARLYGIDAIGEFALATAPTGIVWFLSTVRERPALIRELSGLSARHPRVTGLFYAVFAFSVALTAVISAIAVVAVYFIFRGPIDQPQLFLPAVVNLAAYLLIVNTCWNLDGVFSAFLAGRELFWIRTLQSVSYLAFAAAARLVAPADVWSLTVTLTASYLVSMLYRLVAIRQWMRLIVPWRVVRDGFNALPEILWFGIKATPGSLATGLSTEAGTWILGIFGSVASVGAWNRAWLLGKRLVDLNYRLSEMLFPTLVERQVSGDGPGFDRALLDSLRYVAIAMGLPAAATGGAAVGVMELFGPGFSQASTALALTLLAAMMTVMVVLETQALLAVDRPLLSSWFSVFRMVLTIGTTVPLTIALGITGPALGAAIGCLGQFLVQLVYLRRHLDGPISRFWPKLNMLAVVVSYGAGFAAARVVDTALSGLLGLAAALLAGSLAYVGCIFAMGGVLPRDRARLDQVTRRLRRSLPGGGPPPAVGIEAERLEGA